MRLKSSLSIVTVAGPGDNDYVKANIELIALLNGDSDYRIFVLDNKTGEDSKPLDVQSDLVTVLDGVSQDQSYSIHCRGSYHHAAALNRFLSEGRIETRFLLILDPDFYILYERWISEVISYMDKNDLSFFGAPWHPKWFTKYRYFPCAHCMFIDCTKVNLKDLDFTPDLVERSLAKEEKLKKRNCSTLMADGNDGLPKEQANRAVTAASRKTSYWVKVLSHSMSMSVNALMATYTDNDLPIPITLKITVRSARFLRKITLLPVKLRSIAKGLAAMIINRRLVYSSDDTGFLVNQNFAPNNGYRHECLTPIVNYQTDFLSPPHLRRSYSRWIESLFPDSLRFTPKKGTFVVESDCADLGSLNGIDAQWEKFLWNGKPFGFHMRRYNKVHREPQAELGCLKKVGIQTLDNLQSCSDRRSGKSSFFYVEHST